MEFLPCGSQAITPCCYFVLLSFQRHQNLVFKRSLTLYLKTNKKGLPLSFLSVTRNCVFSFLLPLLINLLFGLLDIVWNAHLHAGRT